MSPARSTRSHLPPRPLTPPERGVDKFIFATTFPDITDSNVDHHLLRQPTPRSEKPLSTAAAVAVAAVAEDYQSATRQQPTTHQLHAMSGVADLLHNPELGQITPPQDDWKVDWDFDNDADGLAPDIHSDQPVPTMPTKKGTKPAVPRQQSEQSSASSSRPTTRRADKRDKYREKNRVAAAKCRAKKKDHVDGLEETHRTQGMLNALLKQTEQNLRDELSFWRTQALQHGYCDCKSVQDYNMRKARDLAANNGLRNSAAARRPSMMDDSQPNQFDSALFDDDQEYGSPPA